MEGDTGGWEDRTGSDHTAGLECQARKPKCKLNTYYKPVKHLFDAIPLIRQNPLHLGIITSVTQEKD